MHVEEKLYTVDEAAEFFRIAPFTMRRWINEKQIEAFKVGREWRISSDSIIAYLEKNRQEAVK